MTTTHEDDVLDRLAVAIGFADDDAVTIEERRWARDLVGSYQSKIAAARRALLPPAAPIQKAAPLRGQLLALTRDALVTRLATVSAALGSHAQYAHRDLDSLSDDDLRRLVQLLEEGAPE